MAAAPILTLTNAGFSTAGKPILHNLTLTLTEPRIGTVSAQGSPVWVLMRRRNS